MRRILVALALAGALMGAGATSANAATLDPGCTKTQGTITCTSTQGPGNNQGGVGSTSTTTTQGNTSNYSPTPQGTGQTCTTNPPKSQGAPSSGC